MDRVKQIVNVERTHRFGYSGKNVRIALLDTGVFLHKELLGKVVYFKDYVNGKNMIYDDNGHGTHIAGIMCGRHYGMAPDAELVVFKILDDKGDGKTKDALSALEWIMKYHKQYQIRIINFSMGYMPKANVKLQKLLMEKLEALWDMGIIVVTAAGNNGPEENTVTVPGISRKVITVGSSDDYEKMITKQKGYGGRGPTTCCVVKPEILAPGTNILSLSNVEDKYERKSGTSMSAPIVSGALALVIEKRPEIQPVEAKLMLYDSVKPMKEKNAAWGLLDVDKLMEML